MDVREKGVSVRGSIIYIDFSFRGIRCRESTGLKNTKANQKHVVGLKATIEHQIALGTFSYAEYFPNSKNSHMGSKLSTKTVSQALDQYIQSARRVLEASTWKSYNSAVQFHLKPTFGELRLSDLTTAHIKSWIGGLTISNKRINNVLIPLRTVFTDAYADGLLDRNPMSRISNLAIRHEEPEPFTPDEIKLICNQLTQQGKNFVHFVEAFFILKCRPVFEGKIKSSIT